VCKGNIISGPRRGKGKYQPNEKANNGNALDGGDGSTPEHECETTRHEANDDGGERTCPGLIDRDPCCQPDEKWDAWTASVNSAQQKTPSPTILRRIPMVIMVVGSRDRVTGAAPSHHHRGAIDSVNRSRARLETPAGHDGEQGFQL
jgi:hypothetical protein